MATDIQWTDETWNPVRGCSLVSPGCVNCYAMKQAHRFSGARTDRATGAPHKHGNDRAPKVQNAPYAGLTKQTKAGPQWTGVVRTIDDALDRPLHWKQPRKIFVNSMSDLFHEDVPDAFIDRVFAVMALAPQHTFQVLTKRAERMRAYMHALDAEWENRLEVAIGSFLDGDWIHNEGKSLRRRIEGGIASVLGIDVDDDGEETMVEQLVWPLPNVWLGVSGENRRFLFERMRELSRTPNALPWVSLEPLLEDISDELRTWLTARALRWVVVGGESGKGARPMQLEWAESVVARCRASKVPVFVKQLGSCWRGISFRVSEGVNQRITDSHGGDMAEWPESLRVRQFPEARS